jgi:hypothetical protein
MKHTWCAFLGLALMYGTCIAESDSTMIPGLTPSAAARVDQIKRENAVRSQCREKYGQEIERRTGELVERIDAYSVEAQRLYHARCSTDVEMNQIREEIDRVAADTAGSMLVLKQKMDVAAARIKALPELAEIRDTIASIEREINQIVSEIVGNDSECRDRMVK